MKAGHKNLTFEGGISLYHPGCSKTWYIPQPDLKITTLLPELPKRMDTGRNVISVLVIIHVRYRAPMQTHDASVTLKVQAGPCQLSKVRLRALLCFGG